MSDVKNFDHLFQDYIRKPFVIGAVQITPMNIDEVAEAVAGEVRHDGKKEGHFSRDYIKVPVKQVINERQTQGYIGDWIVRQGRTFKVYPDKQFQSTFELRANGEVVERKQPAKQTHKNQQRKGKGAKGQQGRPNPGQMPKKRTEGPRKGGVPEVGDKMTGQTHAGITSTPASSDERQPLEARPSPANFQRGDTVTHDSSITPEHANAMARDGKIDWDIDANRPMAETRRLEHEDLSQQNPDEIDETERTLQTVFGETADMTHERRMAERQQLIEEQPKKAITLDELNSMPGDPRSADDIHREAHEAGGGKAYPEQTAGEQFRGEA